MMITVVMLPSPQPSHAIPALIQVKTSSRTVRALTKALYASIQASYSLSSPQGAPNKQKRSRDRVRSRGRGFFFREVVRVLNDVGQLLPISSVKW